MGLRKLRPWGVSQPEPVPMEYWTWVEMSGNGCTMPLLKLILSMQPFRITMLFPQPSIRWELIPPSRNIAVCAAAPGTGRLAMGALLIDCGLEKTINMMQQASAARFHNKNERAA